MISEEFNRENISKEEAESFHIRKAVRCVLFDKDKNIALLHPKGKKWYALPGGGVEEGETFEQAVVRECKEEVGCTICLKTLIGETIEYRKNRRSINKSQGYTAEVVGEKGLPLPEDETSDSDILWIPIDEAILIMDNIPTQEDLYEQYCIERDLLFLKKASVLK